MKTKNSWPGNQLMQSVYWDKGAFFFITNTRTKVDIAIQCAGHLRPQETEGPINGVGPIPSSKESDKTRAHDNMASEATHWSLVNRPLPQPQGLGSIFS